MAVEDLSTYTEEDPNSRLALNGTNEVDFTDLSRNDSSTYLYKDFGVGYFCIHDIEIYLTLEATKESSYGLADFGITNDASDQSNWSNPSLRVGFYGDLKLRLNDGDSYSASDSTVYYCTLQEKDGTLYLYIYSDSDRSNLLDTLSTSVSDETQTYQYIVAIANRADNGGSYVISGLCKDIEIVNAGTIPPPLDNSVFFGTNF